MGKWVAVRRCWPGRARSYPGSECCQCVTECYSVLQCYRVLHIVLQSVTVCYRVLQPECCQCYTDSYPPDYFYLENGKFKIWEHCCLQTGTNHHFKQFLQNINVVDLAKTALNIRKGQNVINFGSQQISISILYCWYYSEHIVELFLHDEALIFRVEPGILNTWTNLFSFCNFTSNDFSMIYSFLFPCLLDLPPFTALKLPIYIPPVIDRRLIYLVIVFFFVPLDRFSNWLSVGFYRTTPGSGWHGVKNFLSQAILQPSRYDQGFLFVCLCICIFVYLCICVFVYLCICIFVFV